MKLDRDSLSVQTVEDYDQKIVLDAALRIQQLSKSNTFDGLTSEEVVLKCIDMYGGRALIALLDAVRNL